MASCSGLQHWVCVSFCGRTLKSNQIAVGCLYNIHAHLSACLDMLVIIVIHKVHSWVRLLMTSLLQLASMVPSSTVKAGQHEGSFPVNTKLISPWPVTKLVSSEIRSSYHVLMDSQEQCQWPVLFGGLCVCLSWGFY